MVSACILIRIFLGGVSPSRNKIRNLFKNINKLGWLVITLSPIFGSNWNNGVKGSLNGWLKWSSDESFKNKVYFKLQEL